MAPADILMAPEALRSACEADAAVCLTDPEQFGFVAGALMPDGTAYVFF
jgi:hypothetical protein